MPSLFSKLYAHRERPRRHHLEGFLTEALADLFARLPDQNRIGLLAQMLGPSCRGASTIETIAYGGRLEVRTQVVTDSGHRPDIVVYLDGTPAIAIEAKIDAAFQRHAGEPDESGRIIETGQLETYAEWIREHGREGWPGAIILITARTDAPVGFAAKDADGPMRSVRTWSDLGRWLAAHAAAAAAGTTHGDLAAELAQFLKEKKLMNRHFNARDLSALSLFADSDSALRHTFQTVIKFMNEGFPRLRRAKGTDCGIDGSLGVYWAWRYLDAWLPQTKFYVAVGVCTEPGAAFDLDRDKLPTEEPFLLIYMDDDDAKQRAIDQVTEVPNGWIELTHRSALACCRAVRTLPAQPDARADETSRWAVEAFGHLVSVLKDRSGPRQQQG